MNGARSAAVSLTHNVARSHYHSGMRVEVLLFAGLAEAAGAASIHIDLPENAVVATLIEGIQSAVPGLRGRIRGVAIAINRRYASPNDPIRPNDELAMIPPVSGG